MSARILVACLVGTEALAAGCTPAVAVCEDKASLVDVRAWRFVEPADDALWPALNDAALCNAGDVQVKPVGDALALEINTRFGCGWATATQTTPRALRVGDRVQTQIFYFPQSSFPTAVAEIAIAIDDEIVVQETLEIPAPSGLLQPVIVVDQDVDVGADVSFHIGNHGDNSWNLVEFAVVRSVPCDDDG